MDNSIRVRCKENYPVNSVEINGDSSFVKIDGNKFSLDEFDFPTNPEKIRKKDSISYALDEVIWSQDSSSIKVNNAIIAISVKMFLLKTKRHLLNH